jgi:hypothetical protein
MIVDFLGFVGSEPGATMSVLFAAGMSESINSFTIAIT